MDEILEYGAFSDEDLVLCGKSTSKQNHDLLPHKIARRAPCSVLLPLVELSELSHRFC